jgi:histone H2B
MPPKAAEKKPSTGGKAPVGGKAPAEKKEAGKKTATAATGEKKKRGKTRKETYSSYIYKGEFLKTTSNFGNKNKTRPY